MINLTIIRISILCFLSAAISCKKSSNEVSTQLSNQQVEYYKRIPDSPIELYSYIESELDDSTRAELCLDIMFRKNKNLSLDMGIIVKDNVLDTIEIQAFYFDKHGIPQKDSTSLPKLNQILNDIDIRQISTLNSIVNGDFVLRLQVERFCAGYMQTNEPEIMTLIDSVKNANE